MSKEEEIKFLEGLVEQTVAKLREHFDSVQLFVSKATDDGKRDTEGFSVGSGNWYARIGQIDEWMQMKKEQTKLYIRKQEDESDNE